METAKTPASLSQKKLILYSHELIMVPKKILLQNQHLQVRIVEEIPSGQVLWFDKSQCKHLRAFVYLIFDCADLSVYKLHYNATTTTVPQTVTFEQTSKYNRNYLGVQSAALKRTIFKT